MIHVWLWGDSGSLHLGVAKFCCLSPWRGGCPLPLHPGHFGLFTWVVPCFHQAYFRQCCWQQRFCGQLETGFSSSQPKEQCGVATSNVRDPDPSINTRGNRAATQGWAVCAIPVAVPQWCLWTQAIRPCPQMPILGFAHRFQMTRNCFCPRAFPQCAAGRDRWG